MTVLNAVLSDVITSSTGIYLNILKDDCLPEPVVAISLAMGTAFMLMMNLLSVPSPNFPCGQLLSVSTHTLIAGTCLNLSV